MAARCRSIGMRIFRSQLMQAERNERKNEKKNEKKEKGKERKPCAASGLNKGDKKKNLFLAPVCPGTDNAEIPDQVKVGRSGDTGGHRQGRTFSEVLPPARTTAVRRN